MNLLITNVGRRDYFIDFLINIKKRIKKLNIYVADNNINKISKNISKVKYLKVEKVGQSKNKYLKQIKHIIKKFSINLIIPCTNYDLDILSINKSFFNKKGCLLSVSENSLIQKLLNKEKMYYLCKKNNIPTPKIFFKISQIDPARKKFIIKDKYGHSSIGLKITDQIKKSNFNKNNIVQEYIDGSEYHLDILNNFNGKFVACCAKKKISMRDGETEKVKIVYNKKLIKYAKIISNVFKHVGNLDCDLIIDKNKNLYFLDFNPRFGGGYPFSHFAGHNYLDIIVRKFPKALKIKRPKLLKFAKGISINGIE